ncbi:hypothetical protein [Leptospira levettii]|uniref:hypothetical protein n=2 Tax=Leptospira levettii TaxID=2023178 RepID=UPI00223E2FCE|nr:hypothetical protein [Leptospira levettii]MCW7474953.1 hypothetical protein [Leptospira levettii]
MIDWFYFSATIVVTAFFLKVVTLPNQFFKIHIKSLFLIGLGFRILCLFLNPIWEDDWARYLWEGQLIRNLISPYEVSPSQFFSVDSIDSFSSEILSTINHPDWTTIYSPFVLFYFSLFTYGKSTFLLKTSYFILETITFWYFNRSHWKKPILLFWLYPIYTKEVYANMHFEVLVITFFWMYWYFLKNKKYKQSGIVFGLLLHTKLLAVIYGIFLVPYLFIQKKKRFLNQSLSFLFSFLIGFFSFYLLYLLVFPKITDFGIINLQRFGDSFTFNQIYEPIWRFCFSINLRSVPFFFQFLLLYIYLYLLIPQNNRNRRFILLCRKYHFVFYLGYFLLTLLPVYNPWYFLILIPLITISRSQSVIPWILISVLQFSYLTNIRLQIPFQFFYEISDQILLLQALISIICLFYYFYQIFILLYNLSNISNMTKKG